MAENGFDIAFTPAVQAQQQRLGSRAGFVRRQQQGRGFATLVDDQLGTFLAGIDSVFLATASADGRPYIQHRGGPKGFIRVLAPDLLGFADFSGNRQYITIGNLAENDRAFLFLMDYRHQRRVKLWGRAWADESADAIARVALPDYPARVERAIHFRLLAWDVNCPSHIPLRLDLDEALSISP